MSTAFGKKYGTSKYGTIQYGSPEPGPLRARPYVTLYRGQQIANTVALVLKGTEISFVETVIRGTTDTDTLKNTHLSYKHNVTITGYVNGVDYQVDYLKGAIKWWTATPPVAGSSYFVSYTFFPDRYIRFLLNKIIPANNSLFITYKYADGTSYDIRGAAYNSRRDLGV